MKNWEDIEFSDYRDDIEVPDGYTDWIGDGDSKLPLEYKRSELQKWFKEKYLNNINDILAIHRKIFSSYLHLECNHEYILIFYTDGRVKEVKAAFTFDNLGLLNLSGNFLTTIACSSNSVLNFNNLTLDLFYNPITLELEPLVETDNKFIIFSVYLKINDALPHHPSNWFIKDDDNKYYELLDFDVSRRSKDCEKFLKFYDCAKINFAWKEYKELTRIYNDLSNEDKLELEIKDKINKKISDI